MNCKRLEVDGQVVLVSTTHKLSDEDLHAAARMMVRGTRGKWTPAEALTDSGITEKQAAKRLGLTMLGLLQLLAGDANRQQRRAFEKLVGLPVAWPSASEEGAMKL